jgi:hypothetical protein
MISKILCLVFMSSLAFAQGTPTTPAAGAPAAKNPAVAADKLAVDNACKAESAAGNCGNEQVGTGLRRCIHKAKKEKGSAFVISAGCKEAMEKLKEDKHH